MPSHLGKNVVRPLIGDQATREFYVRFARQHGFAAGPLIAAIKTVNFERRAIPLAGQHAVAALAESDRHANLSEIFFLIERQALERFRQRRLDLLNIIIKSFDCNPSVVVQRGDEFRGCVQWIGYAAAVTAGVEIVTWTPHREGKRSQAPRTYRDARRFGAPHAAVG